MVKFASILEDASGRFGLQYDNTLGKKHTMRLDAVTYEQALREARAFLEIRDDGRDVHGMIWELE